MEITQQNKKHMKITQKTKRKRIHEKNSKNKRNMKIT